ncbi:hypothetical protein V5E97_20080 [Singulisphaera sp. Ch08]|uniref:Uncharacterized protein n=1 Tax=Singulisphaera sp. Ch08 TaxID=3120278 RepID=A0AAU7CT90_9BACT
MTTGPALWPGSVTRANAQTEVTDPGHNDVNDWKANRYSEAKNPKDRERPAPHSPGY